MKRVLVIGCPGSGKSTFSRRLAKKTGFELFHLDLLYWRADRTTVCREFHTEKEFREIAELISGAPRYFIQNYNPEGVHIGKELTPYNKEELEAFLPLFAGRVGQVELRGM